MKGKPTKRRNRSPHGGQQRIFCNIGYLNTKWQQPPTNAWKFKDATHRK